MSCPPFPPKNHRFRMLGDPGEPWWVSPSGEGVTLAPTCQSEYERLLVFRDLIVHDACGSWLAEAVSVSEKLDLTKALQWCQDFITEQSKNACIETFERWCRWRPRLGADKPD